MNLIDVVMIVVITLVVDQVIHWLIPNKKR